MGQANNNKERRITHDRRKFTYTAYSPERRAGIDRRAILTNTNAKVVKGIMYAV